MHVNIITFLRVIFVSRASRYRRDSSAKDAAALILLIKNALADLASARWDNTLDRNIGPAILSLDHHT